MTTDELLCFAIAVFAFGVFSGIVVTIHVVSKALALRPSTPGPVGAAGKTGPSGPVGATGAAGPDHD